MIKAKVFVHWCTALISQSNHDNVMEIGPEGGNADLDKHGPTGIQLIMHNIGSFFRIGSFKMPKGVLFEFDVTKDATI